jgi:hypothetical protein
LPSFGLFIIEIFLPENLFLGKYEGTFFWHGRDNMATRELNPKVWEQFLVAFYHYQVN